MAQTEIKVAKKRAPAKAPPETSKKEDKLYPRQKIVDARATKAPEPPKVPTINEVRDLDWMNWVEYAQSRIRYLENKVEQLLDINHTHKQ